MPITPHWYDANKQIYWFEYTYPVRDWQEYRHAIDKGMAEIRMVNHTVIVLMDPEDIDMPPGNPLPHLRYAVRIMPKNVTAMVAIVNNHFAATIMGWLKKIGFLHWLYVLETREQAEEQIKELLVEKEVIP